MANFVETELILLTEDRSVSHLQIRGSVPIFWTQPGINFGQHKTNIDRVEKALFLKYFDFVLDLF